MIRHFKGDPSRYIIKYVSGKIKTQGRGISFYYWSHKTSIISIPRNTIDSHFIFNEVSGDYQTITLQGHLTYKIKDPVKMDTLLNFQIEPQTGDFISEDPEKLELRIKNVVQMACRGEVKKVNLEDALALNTTLSSTVLDRVDEVPILDEMGIEVLSITFNAIKPTPEIADALEAEYRELLQQNADRSIYARRAAAVEQEQRIRENELNTDISLAKKRTDLVDLNGENQIREAEFSSKARNMELELYKGVDPRVLMALSFLGLSDNAGKIGNLTITSEILSSLLENHTTPIGGN